jgi:hypothetical protein
LDERRNEMTDLSFFNTQPQPISVADFLAFIEKLDIDYTETFIGIEVGDHYYDTDELMLSYERKLNRVILEGGR